MRTHWKISELVVAHLSRLRWPDSRLERSFKASDFEEMAKGLKATRSAFIYSQLIPRMSVGKLSPISNFSRLVALIDRMTSDDDLAADDLRVALARCLVPHVETGEFPLKHLKLVVALIDSVQREHEQVADDLRVALARCLVPHVETGEFPLKHLKLVAALIDSVQREHEQVADDLRVALARCLVTRETGQFLLEHLNVLVTLIDALQSDQVAHDLRVTLARRLVSWAKAGQLSLNLFARLVALIDAIHPEQVVHDLRNVLRKQFLGLPESGKGTRRGNHGQKIAYLAGSRMPSRLANSVHVMKMCSAIARAGHDVVLVARRSTDISILSRDWPSNFSTDPFEYSLLDDEIRNSVQAAGLMLREGLKMGATHFCGRSLVGSYAAALAQMPVTLECHAPILTARDPIARDLFRQPTFRGLVVISEALRDWFGHQYPDLRRIVVVPDGADAPNAGLRPFDFADNGPAGFRVGYAGHLYPGKGVEIIIEVAKKLPGASFHLLGGHVEDIAIWRLKAAGLKNIFFYGFRPHVEVSSFLSGIDVALAPYLREVRVYGGGEVSKWMSPLKLFEYMAHSLPIISSDLPVLKEVLEHERNALLCDPDNINEWVAAIQRLKTDNILRSQLGGQAWSDFERRYSWDKRAERALSPLLHDGN